MLWFRRDLRLDDHQALTAALRSTGEQGALVPLFVVDPVLWDRSGPNRRWFLHGALAALDAEDGCPAPVFPIWFEMLLAAAAIAVATLVFAS